MRVAYYSPLPPERSGIADYSALLLPALRERIDVEVIRPGFRLRRPRPDVDLYHVGNDPRAHGWIVDRLRRKPGVVVLHDFVLHHLVAGVTLGRGDGAAYLAAMEREGGAVGRMLAHGVIDGLVPPLWETRAADFPLAGEVLPSAVGVIVHSAYVEARVREAGFAGPIWRIPHPAWEPPASVPAATLPAGRPVIGSFGHVNPAKRLPVLLQAFARLRERAPEAVLAVVGAGSAPALRDAVAQEQGLQLNEDVIVFDYVPEPELWGLIRRSDVCVALRYPTMGETSGIAIRALALGRPLVVSDVGWFSELPNAAVAKVAVGDVEHEVLAGELVRLLGDASARERMGAAAMELVRREHDIGRVADAYVAALEVAAGGRSVDDGVLGAVTRAAHEVGLAPDGPAVGEIAARLREVRSGR